MTAFVIELGVDSGEGKFRQWSSGGFYKGYTDKGPILVATIEEAFKFPAERNASYVVAGDSRLKQSRILPVDAKPDWEEMRPNHYPPSAR